MCRLGPEGYGSISSWYQWRSGVGSPGTGFGTLKARSSSQTRCHLASISCGSYRSTAVEEYAVQTCPVLELFPESALVEDGRLTLGGVPASRLAAEHGTPLLVYCEQTIRAQARAYREAAPDALVVYGTKAFANVALLRLLAEEGVGADVSTLGELAFARAAGIPGERIVFHGNNKSLEELRAAGEAGALVVLDAAHEVDAAAAAGVRRVLVRLTPGVEAVTHRSIQTAHEESKFGLAPDAAAEAVERARERLEAAAVEREQRVAVDVALDRARAQLESFAASAAELEATLPGRVEEAVHDSVRGQVQPVGRNLAEIRGLMNQVLRRLERLEGDLLTERHARVDDLALLVDLIGGGWRSVEQRLIRLEEGLRREDGAVVYHLDDRQVS